MELEKKGLWLPIAILAAGALISLVGGIIGKTVLGWILFSAGFAIAAALLIVRFSVIKQLFATKKILTITGGIVLVVILAAAIVIMLTGKSKAQMAGPAVGSIITPLPTVALIEAPTAVFTATPTIEPTAAATITATTVSSLFVCLNEKTQVGYSIRVAPRKDAAFGGLLNWGTCFTVDGKAAGFPGWYHVAKGQDGQVGVEINVNEDAYQLWVDGYYLESFGENLEVLPDIIVINQ